MSNKATGPETYVKYWTWLLVGLRDDESSSNRARPGISAFWNRWLLCHVAVGLGMAYVTSITMREAASVVLLPLTSVLVGLCFAWGGNALAIMQTEEAELLARANRVGGMVYYVYTYQTAVLVLIITLVAWGLCGLGVVDSTWPAASSPGAGLAAKWTVFSLSSLAIRECWHVVLGAHWLLLSRSRIREERKADGS